MPAPLTVQQIALYMSKRRAGSRQEVAAAGTTVDVDRLRQNTRYQDISLSLSADQRRGAGALGVVPLTASR
jgi:hypothetical protein